MKEREQKHDHEAGSLGSGLCSSAYLLWAFRQAGCLSGPRL